MSGLAISANNIRRTFGSAVALNDVTLEVRNGEFVSLVGPSGCGKTTLLRILGGFDQADSGLVSIDGKDVSRLAPDKRSSNMVFQRGALFPHLTVAENISYGLRRKGLPEREIAGRVSEMLELIRLSAFGPRKPSELSGGQAQRVALARALINRPPVLLLDEPFSALDLALRKELQLELKRIHREFGCAFVFVTHDQEEALVLSDRIAIMNGGQVLQFCPPIELYREPAGLFAAQFIGEMNVLKGRLTAVGPDTSTVEIGRNTLSVPGVAKGVGVGDEAFVLIRPENVALAQAGPNTLSAIVEEAVYVGSRWRLRLVSEHLDDPIWAEASTSAAGAGLERGTPIHFTIQAQYGRILAVE